MLSWLGLGSRRAPEAGDATGAACSFCRKTQREVRKLIAGPNAMICDECVALCVAVIDEEAGEGERFPGAIGALAEELRSAKVRAGAVDAVGAAALALADDDADALRTIARAAFAGAHETIARDALRRIDPAARTTSDHVETAVALYRLGEYEDAATALDDARPATREESASVDVTRIAIALRRERDLDAARVERMLATLEAAERHLDPLHATSIATCRAECHLRRGEARAAREALEALAASPAPGELARMLLGEVALALGEREVALEHLRAAAAANGPVAEEARRRLARETSEPYR